MERFRAWLEAYATALEAGDTGALDVLFAVEASYRPGPFQPVLHGRQAIREHVAAQLVGRAGLSVQAKALGIGTTYGVAHWVAAWTDRDGDRVLDGMLLAAFDPFGRCTSLREWSIAGEGPAPAINA